MGYPGLERLKQTLRENEGGELESNILFGFAVLIPIIVVGAGIYSIYEYFCH